MTLTPAQPIRKVFGDMVARHLYRLFARAGFQREGRRLWWERRNDAWAMIELRLSHRSTRNRLEFSIGTGAWPPGTWPAYRSRFALTDERWYSLPFLAANGPITALPGEVAPTLWPERDLWAFDESIDAQGLGRELAAFCTEAIAWARSYCEIENALEYLTRRPAHGLLFAVEMLATAAPGHPRLPELVEALTSRWVADPRPITLRAHIQRWRAETGLPPAEHLPWYWHPAMLEADRLGWPEAAYLVGQRGEFHLADGSRTKVAPHDWPRPRRTGWRRWLRGQH